MNTKREARPTFRGLYVRKTKTKKEKLEAAARKHKKDLSREVF